MREAAFLRRNADRWKEFERLLDARGKGATPDQLADLFVQVTDDLSYARTFYPQSRSTAYLNALALRVHQAIYRNRREKRGRFWTFWRQEVPIALFQSRRELVYALIVFVVAATIGAMSTAADDDFVRLILGDHYVNMTLENIRRGEPMGVYGHVGEGGMLAAISVNNILVSFLVFAQGLLVSIGTAWQLFRNGVMLGSFQYFFHQHDLLFESTIVIWIHGTLEIASIIVAGGGGFALGNSILFPGTYSRMESFRQGARRGLKIIIGLVPLFFLAAILESFVTRHTNMPVALSLSIIGLSATFVIWYFVIYPRTVNAHITHEDHAGR